MNELDVILLIVNKELEQFEFQETVDNYEEGYMHGLERVKNLIITNNLDNKGK
jgi:hypothetical protein